MCVGVREIVWGVSCDRARFVLASRTSRTSLAFVSLASDLLVIVTDTSDEWKKLIESMLVLPVSMISSSTIAILL